MLAGRSVILVAMFAAATAGSAFAQTTRVEEPLHDGYIAGMGGAVSGPPTESVFSVEYGEDINRWSQAYVALSYFENLMRQDVHDELTTLGATLTGITGDPFQFRGRDRGIALTAGGKLVVGDFGTTFRPYVGGGGGIINLRRIIAEARLGEVTNAVFNDFRIGEPDLIANDGVTRPLVEAVAGVGINAGHTYVDVAYRFRRAFRVDEALDFSQLTVGIGYRF